MKISLHSFMATAAISAILLMMPITPVRAAADLWEIYRMALANDATYQATVLGHEANLLELPLAKTAFGPVIEGSGHLGKDQSDITGSSTSGDDHNLNLNFNLRLYDRTKRSDITQSEYRTEISALSLKDARQILILRVANRYFNLLAGRDALEVATVEKIAIKRQMDLATERLEVGLGTRTDLYDARARYKLAVADEIQAQNKINNDIALLKQIIGVTPQVLVPLSESAPLELPSPNDVDVWIDRSLVNNVQLNIQLLDMDVALEEIDKQKNIRSASISLDGNYRWADTDSTFTGGSGSYNTATVRLQLKYPIFLAGSINLRTEQAGLEYNQSEREVEEARRAASAEATSAFLDISSGVSQVEALYDAITAGESALEAKEEGFNAGLTTNLDVLDAQRDLSKSRTDYLRARYTYILSVLALERAAGDLDEEDITRINNWLSK